MAERNLAVIGLGYVGLTTAVAFGVTRPVIGYDKNPQRIAELKDHYDLNEEITAAELAQADINYTDSAETLTKSDFYIVSVPTPLDAHKNPDMTILLDACKNLAKYLKRDDIVVFESTVYPGATEEECIPILEKNSKLKCGVDFGVAFSPERVNPGDKKHVFTNVIKIIGASDPQTLKIVADVYSGVITAGVHLVSNIRTAEATKIIENIQRDINIAYLNEVAMILHGLGIELTEVLQAMQTKWTALNFKPGLVGGHCIGVNAHYLAYKAQHQHLKPNLIMAARDVNEYMPQYLANITSNMLKDLGVHMKSARIGVLGLTYKENCPDLKDTLVIEIVQELSKQGAQMLVYDPVANAELAQQQYHVKLSVWSELQDLDAIIIAVAHGVFIGKEKEMSACLKNPGVLVDVKGIIDRTKIDIQIIKLWQI